MKLTTEADGITESSHNVQPSTGVYVVLCKCLVSPVAYLNKAMIDIRFHPIRCCLLVGQFKYLSPCQMLLSLGITIHV